MKTIKIIEGKAFMCEEITPNNANFEFIPITWNIHYLIGAVRQRMFQCLDSLETSVKDDKVFKVEENLIHHEGGIFVISSYMAMESLLKKLEEERETTTTLLVDTVWLELKLTVEEAAQLFKAYVASTDHFDTKEMRLLDVVMTLRKRQGIGDPE